MTDQERPDGWWAEVVATLEADPHALDMHFAEGASTAELVAKFPELAQVIVRDLVLDGPHGPIPARSYRLPSAEGASGLVWNHGGAFILGSINMAEGHWVSLTLAARGVPVLSVEYRRAIGPDRFPVPSDDVIAAHAWAVAHADELGMRGDRVHLGGASAGANLAAGAAKRVAQGVAAGEVPASLVLAYGVYHSTMPATDDPLLVDLVDTLKDVAPIQFVGVPEMLTDAYAFPGYGSVESMPPCLMVDSEDDVLRRSGEAMAAALRAARVEVSHVVERGTSHGHLNSPEHPGAVRTIDRIVEWITRR